MFHIAFLYQLTLSYWTLLFYQIVPLCRRCHSLDVVLPPGIPLPLNILPLGNTSIRGKYSESIVRDNILIKTAPAR